MKSAWPDTSFYGLDHPTIYLMVAVRVAHARATQASKTIVQFLYLLQRGEAREIFSFSDTSPSIVRWRYAEKPAACFEPSAY
jgi:hypothetical protein